MPPGIRTAALRRGEGVVQKVTAWVRGLIGFKANGLG